MNAQLASGKRRSRPAKKKVSFKGIDLDNALPQENEDIIVTTGISGKKHIKVKNKEKPKTPTIPWVKANMLGELKLKDPRFVKRWIDTGIDGKNTINVSNKLYEGWQFVDQDDLDIGDKRILDTISPIEGQSVDTKVRRRELVLMKLPRTEKDAKDMGLPAGRSLEARNIYQESQIHNLKKKSRKEAFQKIIEESEGGLDVYGNEESEVEIGNEF